MKSIGIICEFNPLHNGHIHLINTIKNKYPNHLIVLVLNGYFLERGEVSIINKENKTKLSLENGVDIVLELPLIYGTQSADIFASKSVEILNHFKVEKIIFGSENNDFSFLKELAQNELSENFKTKIKKYLSLGESYPSAVSKAHNLKKELFNPNDILGVAYTKAVVNNNYNIELETIQRTNSFNDLHSNEKILSATIIRI
jgi:predicted nucleotidyltransferase